MFCVPSTVTLGMSLGWLHSTTGLFRKKSCVRVRNGTDSAVAALSEISVCCSCVHCEGESVCSLVGCS